MKEIYSNAIIQNVPRLLGLLDRNKNSPTYGCFDRQFWHYKVVDFSAARMQEAALTLALLYKNKYYKNVFSGQANFKEWAIAAMEFWGSIQSKNGSFSEWYPNENSFVATSLSTYAISEAFLLLRNEIADERKHSIENALRKAFDWLSKNKDLTASSQQGGAACALYNAYLITGETHYLNICANRLNLLHSKRSGEGWFPEYGGADIGYLSVFLDYLAKIYTKNKRIKSDIISNENLKNSLKNGYEFMSYFMHPDFSFGGEYGSRNTEYVVPDGIEIASAFSEHARFISKCTLQNIKINNFNYDDRYFTYYGYTYLQAADNYSKNKTSKNLWKRSFSRTFSDAGIHIISTPKIYCIIGLRKGGVVKAFTKSGKRIADDCGISGKIEDGMYISTQHTRKDYSFRIANSNSVPSERNAPIEISGNFYEMPAIVPSPFKTLLSRGFQSTIGKSNIISKKSKEILRKNLINVSNELSLEFTRKVSVTNNSVKIEDVIRNPKNIKLESLSLGGKFSYIYIPSSRYFFANDSLAQSQDLTQEEIGRLNEGYEISIKREFRT